MSRRSRRRKARMRFSGLSVFDGYLILGLFVGIYAKLLCGLCEEGQLCRAYCLFPRHNVSNNLLPGFAP